MDEWDMLIRDESAKENVQKEYIDFLRGMFKGTEPTKYIQLAYLTGILPIKKIKTQSALNNFDEFTMLDAGRLAPYIGFTETEVKQLCSKYKVDFDKVKRWYDGYLLEKIQVYNPKAVVSVLTKEKFKSYWSETGTYESIIPLINMNFDGLKNAVIEMLSGANVEVDVTFFQNDTVNFADKDDVLTYLIHLGYLGYDEETESAFVPNEEIRQELIRATKRTKWNQMIEFQNTMMENNYANLKEALEENRRINHDMKNHLLLLKEYEKRQDWKELRSYLDKITPEYESVKFYPWTTCQPLDLLLNLKMHMAEKKKIVWKITACSLEKFVLEENEICILFGNLLDNALEASEKVEKGEKWIKTEIQNPRNMLFINIANSMEKQPVREGKRWISQKENQKFHGYGLISVERIVEKYEGTIRYLVTKDRFEVQVSFFMS